MRLRFFADHCVPTSLTNSLQAAGFKVFKLKDYLPADSSDPVVIAKEQELDAFLVSLNGDFADIDR